MIIVHSLLIRI